MQAPACRGGGEPGARAGQPGPVPQSDEWGTEQGQEGEHSETWGRHCGALETVYLATRSPPPPANLPPSPPLLPLSPHFTSTP